jgi:hypothetical protein
MGLDVLTGKKDLSKRVTKALLLDPEYKAGEIFVVLNNAVKDPNGFIQRTRTETLEYPLESISIAMRKLKAENPELRGRDRVHKMIKAKFVSENINLDSMNDFKIKNGDIFGLS